MIKHDADRDRAEAILLGVARRHTADIVANAIPALGRLRERYFLPEEIALEPAVYMHVTDNWLELSLRFLPLPPLVLGEFRCHMVSSMIGESLPKLPDCSIRSNRPQTQGRKALDVAMP